MTVNIYQVNVSMLAFDVFDVKLAQSTATYSLTEAVAWL